jgi:glycosyltransferase involved in cell wall biosynthesis
MKTLMRIPRRVAFFNPIIAHYRAALVRELRSNEDYAYDWFADDHDEYGNIPVLDLTADPRFHRCPRVMIFGRFTWQFGTIRAALLGDFDAYIFEGDAQFISSWIGAVLARVRGKRVLFWSHGWTRLDTGLKRIVRLSFYRLAHGLLLYGDRAKRIGIGFGLPSETLYVMFNSLDVDGQHILMDSITPEETSALRSELFGEDTAPIVIATARLTRKKRFDLLIRALGVLMRKGVRVQLLLVGDGPARRELERLAVREGVIAAFTGACYDDSRLARYFSLAAATVSPGDVGLTCMHSLGFGVPVITHGDADSQMPEWEAIVPGLTGDTFAKDDHEDLARKIERWTRSASVDPATRHACLARVSERYHAHSQARTMELALCGRPAVDFPGAVLGGAG